MEEESEINEHSGGIIGGGSMEEESWRRNHGGGIMEGESWRSNHRGGIIGGGIMEEESWRHCGGIMEEESWRRNLGGGSMEEESGRHLGGIWEESGRLGWPWWLKGILGAKCVKTILFYCKSERDRPLRLDEMKASVTKWCKN